MATKTSTSTPVCRGRQTTAWGGSNVQHPIAKFRSKIRNVRFKMADPAGTENRKRSRKTHKKTPPPSPRENTPPRKYPRNRRVVPSPSEDVPAASRTRRMAKEMKKLRSLHILHVPPSRSKTKARWHWRLMFLQPIVLKPICGFCRCLVMFDPLFHPFHPYFTHFTLISQIKCNLAKHLVLHLGSM